jgi:hypothetical protein
VAVVAARAMGRIEVHDRRLVAQDKSIARKQNRQRRSGLPEYGTFDGGSINKLWRTASA